MASLLGSISVTQTSHLQPPIYQKNRLLKKVQKKILIQAKKQAVKRTAYNYRQVINVSKKILHQAVFQAVNNQNSFRRFWLTLTSCFMKACTFLANGLVLQSTPYTLVGQTPPTQGYFCLHPPLVIYCKSNLLSWNRICIFVYLTISRFVLS